MFYRNAILISAAMLSVVGARGASSAARGPCNDSLTRGIPARAPDALSGRAFAEKLRGLSDDERESSIGRELNAGNIPAFLRRLVPVRLPPHTVDGQPVDIIICAAPDYLAVGSDQDFLLMPMRLATALSAAYNFGFTLPTPRMVDAIYAQAAAHLVPQPLPAGDEMRSTQYSLHHNELVAGQRVDLGVDLGELIAGDKKDIVLTNRLRSHPDRVAIYGWHASNGRPIQPLSTVHGWRYADYSHGVRLVSTDIFVNGQPRSIFSALQDSRLARALSDEGVISDVVGLIAALDQRTRAVIAAIR
jgi:hypothetical protein